MIRPMRWIPVAALLVIVAGCAKRGQAPMSGETTGMSGTSASTPQASKIIDPHPNDWEYKIDPVPAPSVRPKYRLNEITFTPNSTSYGAEGSGVCREVGDYLSGHPNARLLLVGHCYKDEANPNDLAMNRDRTVRDCLKANGVTEDRCEMTSFGSTFSTADETQPMMMEQERRVEIWVLSE